MVVLMTYHTAKEKKMLTVSKKRLLPPLMLAFVIASALLITSVMPPTATAQPIDVCAEAKNAAWRFVRLWVGIDEAIWKSPLTKVGLQQQKKMIMDLQVKLKGSLRDHARLLQAASEKCPHYALELIADEAWAQDLTARDMARIWNSYQNILKP